MAAPVGAGGWPRPAALRRAAPRGMLAEKGGGIFMPIQTEVVSTGLRLTDAAGKGIRSVSGVKPGLSRTEEADFRGAYNRLSAAQATNSALTVRTRIFR